MPPESEPLLSCQVRIEMSLPDNGLLFVFSHTLIIGMSLTGLDHRLGHLFFIGAMAGTIIMAA
jgi:hypothetical protein